MKKLSPIVCISLWSDFSHCGEISVVYFTQTESSDEDQFIQVLKCVSGNAYNKPSIIKISRVLLLTTLLNGAKFTIMSFLKKIQLSNFGSITFGILFVCFCSFAFFNFFFLTHWHWYLIIFSQKMVLWLSFVFSKRTFIIGWKVH